MFENRALRRVFGPKRDEVTGERRRLHNEEVQAAAERTPLFQKRRNSKPKKIQ